MSDRENRIEKLFGTVEQQLRMLRQVERERQAAVGIDALLRRTPAEEWPALAERPDLQTCGALERLAIIVGVEMTREPKYAKAVAQLAVSLAEGLPEHSYPAVIRAQLRALAWKDLGKTLGFLGRYDESMDALAQAEALVTGFDVLSHDLAVIRFNQALTLQEVDRHRESFVLFTECKEVFRRFGDTRLLVLCGLAEGVLLQRLRRYREAREIYLLLLAANAEIDTESRAALHRGIGMCSIELGDFADAEANLTRSIEFNRQLGQRVEELKSEALRGRLLIRRAKLTAALTQLRPVRRELLRHTLNEEAGICGLEMVEAYMLLGRNEDAENLARTIVKQFMAASLNARAITAVGYLSEAIAARKATIALVHHVRQYVITLRTSPEREFRPTAAELS